MAKKKRAREIIKLKSTESAEIYSTEKNKGNSPGRLELRKFDRSLRRYVMFREAK